MSKSLLKSTGVVVTMTMISRVFGFLRDMVTAQMFGAGAAFDAFSVAFKIPNFMRRLFAEGSFSQAFVPILSEYQKKKSHEEVQNFINAAVGSLGVVLLVVTIVGIMGAPWIIRVFAPGFATQGARFDLAVSMLRITFPYLMLISFTAFSGAILNTYSRYWVAAFTPVFLNVCMIAAALWLSVYFSVPTKALAWGVLTAGVIQLVFQWPFLRRLRLLPHPVINFKHIGVIRVLKLMVPALFGVSVSQINLLLDTVFASFLMVGSVSWLYYSDRLMEFPLGVFGVAISTVILPHLSRHYVSQSPQYFSLTLDWALRMVLLIGIPAGVVLAVLAVPLLSTLFHYGHFDNNAVMMAHKSVMMFAIGIAPCMLIKILAAGFYAKQDLRTPVRIGILAMLSNMVLNCLFILPFAHAGIALATSLAAVVNAGFLYYYLRRLEIYTPRAGWQIFGLRLLAANVVLVIWLNQGAGEASTWLTQSALWRLTHLLGLLVSAIVIYFITLWVSGVRIRDLLVPPESSEEATV